MNISFAISEWSGWKSNTSSADLEQDYLTITENPDISSMPPLLRRRLNLLGRSCASEILKHIKQGEKMPVVYCSQHGDIERTFKSLEGAAKGELTSPMNFSLSVHNAILGVISIHLGLTSSISSISSGQQGLVPVLLEAMGIIISGADKVLCVLCDVVLPAIYFDEQSLPRNSYAISFVVTKSKGINLNLKQSEGGSEIRNSKQMPTTLIKFLSSEKNELHLNHNGLIWKLAKK